MDAVNVMCVLLSVLYVWMLKGCDGDGNTGVGAVGGLVAGCEYMGGTRVVQFLCLLSTMYLR